MQLGWLRGQFSDRLYPGGDGQLRLGIAAAGTDRRGWLRRGTASWQRTAAQNRSCRRTKPTLT